MAIILHIILSVYIIRLVCSNAFKYKEFGSYWFETGTPTYLVKLLKKHHYDLERMAHEETDAQVLNSIDSESTTRFQ